MSAPMLLRRELGRGQGPQQLQPPRQQPREQSVWEA